jgi:outer membrane protein
MKRLLMASAAILFASGAASAQDNRDIRVRVGLGAQLQPEFIGADETRLAPLFHINFARGTDQFRFVAPDDHVGVSLVSVGGFSLGPVANIRAKRTPADVGAPVARIPRTFEAGAFVQYQAGNSFRVRADILRGLGGHDGLVGSIGVDRIWRDGDRYVFSIGPRILFSDARFQRAYFGVTPAVSLASGLPAYRPGGGVHAVALASGLSYELTSRWGVFGYARYARLVGDAARSPIVRQLGSRNQLSGGIGLNYIFTVRR